MSTTQQCEGCAIRVTEHREPVCDGSGVIAVSEWPAERSYVVVCPEYACDSEPDAIWEAAAWLDPAPHVTERVRTNVMDAIHREHNVINTATDLRWLGITLAIVSAVGVITLISWIAR